MSITENVALFTESQVKSEDFAYFFFSPVSSDLICLLKGMLLRDSRGAKLFSTDIFKGMSYSYC